MNIFCEEPHSHTPVAACLTEARNSKIAYKMMISKSASTPRTMSQHNQGNCHQAIKNV